MSTLNKLINTAVYTWEKIPQSIQDLCNAIDDFASSVGVKDDMIYTEIENNTLNVYIIAEDMLNAVVQDDNKECFMKILELSNYFSASGIKYNGEIVYEDEGDEPVGFVIAITTFLEEHN